MDQNNWILCQSLYPQDTGILWRCADLWYLCIVQYTLAVYLQDPSSGIVVLRDPSFGIIWDFGHSRLLNRILRATAKFCNASLQCRKSALMNLYAGPLNNPDVILMLLSIFCRHSKKNRIFPFLADLCVPIQSADQMSTCRGARNS